MPNIFTQNLQMNNITNWLTSYTFESYWKKFGSNGTILQILDHLLLKTQQLFTQTIFDPK